MKLNGIWNDDYVCRLGILDHCQELIVLNDEIRRYKAKYGHDENNLEPQFAKEAADLLLILSQWFNTNLETGNIIVMSRFNRFGEKAEIVKEEQQELHFSDVPKVNRPLEKDDEITKAAEQIPDTIIKSSIVG